MSAEEVAQAYNDAILSAISLLGREHRVRPAVRVRMYHALQQAMEPLLNGPAQAEASKLLSQLGAHAREALAEVDQEDEDRAQAAIAQLDQAAARRLEEQRVETEERLARARATSPSAA